MDHKGLAFQMIPFVQTSRDINKWVPLSIDNEKHLFDRAWNFLSPN